MGVHDDISFTLHKHLSVQELLLIGYVLDSQ